MRLNKLYDLQFLVHSTRLSAIKWAVLLKKTSKTTIQHLLCIPLNGSPNVYVYIIPLDKNNAILFIFFGIITYIDNMFLVKDFNIGHYNLYNFNNGSPISNTHCTIDYSLDAFFTSFLGFLHLLFYIRKMNDIFLLF